MYNGNIYIDEEMNVFFVFKLIIIIIFKFYLYLLIVDKLWKDVYIIFFFCVLFCSEVR